MLLAVRISSYGCTWKVWRALKKLELLLALPRATLTHLSCSPNFPRASITRYTYAKHGKILKFCITFVFNFSWILQPSQEKLKTMLMQNFGGQICCIAGDVQETYS